MPFDKKRKIQWIRIFLAIFYAFELSEGVRLIGEGIVKAFVPPRDPYATAWIVVGALFIVWASLAIYAIWHNRRIMLLVSGIVLIAFCVLLPAFGVFAIAISYEYDASTLTDKAKAILVEYFKVLLFDLGAIWATSVFVRHLKSEHAPVSTQPI